MAKTINNRDTYKATSITCLLIGTLLLVNKFISFQSMGLAWVMDKNNFILYAGIIFLLFKRDKTIGVVLTAIWLLINIGVVMGVLGALSAYILPITLLIIGGALYFASTK